MNLVAFDLETTGLDAERARIVEFAFIELDEALGELSRWSELVDPLMPIPAETVKIHGITDEMVKGRPPFAHFASRIQALVQGAVLVAHNHKFDLEILSRELERSGQPGLRPNHPCIDTQRIEAFVNSHSLAETYKRYHDGRAFEGGHRSEADTLATVAVLRRQRAVHGEKLPATVEDLLVANLDRLRNPERAQREFLDHGRWIYADDKGVFHYNRGRHKGRPVFADAETRDYLRWMRDKPEIAAGMERTLDSLLVEARRRDGEERAAASPPVAGHGKFHRAASGQLAFSFGRYRGCPAIEEHECAVDLRRRSHTDYLRWMQGKADFAPEVKAFVAELLQTRSGSPTSASAPPATPAQAATGPGGGA